MKKIIAMALIAAMLLAFTACGNTNTRKFEYAYITLPNGNVIEVEVDTCVTYPTGVRIWAKDGRKYMTSIVNCLLTTDRLNEVEKCD